MPFGCIKKLRSARAFKEPLKLAEIVAIPVLIKGELLSKISRTVSDTIEETRENHKPSMRVM